MGAEPTPRLRAAVVADDLTGAADSGVQLARAGYRTAVAFPGAPVPPGTGLDAVVADTDSRAADTRTAGERVRAAVGALAGAPVLLKKVDSTLRGPVAAEIAAALAASARRAVIVAPAFPGTGRTTADGVQLVDGAPVHRTRFAADPVAPVRDAHLPKLLAAEGLEGAPVVRAGDAAALARALRDGARAVVADARTDADLDALVAAVPDPSAVLWAGSAGLARALGAAHPGPAPPPPAAATADGRALVVVGSANVVAREQVVRLVATGVPAVELGLAGLGPEAIAACRAAARTALENEGACVVHPAGPGDGPDLPRRIAAALGQVAAGLAGAGLVDGLVLTGGDTALSVARRLGATGLRVDAELEPGVPIGRLLGPAPYRVVTKAGGFGSPDVLVTACEALAGSKRRAFT
ncbi:MAG TPA: four-carbon acid sugar kinase family protein [Solirubrobacteraceae bacterium]|nr:four-carbon acid sugar kinase family protein [Solirubrobacteraceae bacterium]